MPLRPAEACFIGSHTAKVDAKGRIALPADFRRALDKRFNGFYATPNIHNPDYLDCGGSDFLERAQQRLKRLKPLSKERAVLQASIMGRMRPVALDTDGRFILPQFLKDKARVKDSAFMIGLGDTFQIRTGADADEQMQDYEDEAKKYAHLLEDFDEEGNA